MFASNENVKCKTDTYIILQILQDRWSECTAFERKHVKEQNPFFTKIDFFFSIDMLITFFCNLIQSLKKINLVTFSQNNIHDTKKEKKSISLLIKRR